jgi:hypothetical protein
MTSVAPKPWIALLATGGMAVAPFFLSSPAKAADPPCPGSVPISDIVATGNTGYKCILGDITYDFFNGNDLGELNTPGSVLEFFDSSSFQSLTFNNLDHIGPAAFSYKVLSPTYIILSAVQTYLQNPTSPPALVSSLSANTTFPRPPSPDTTFTLDAQFDTDMSDPFDIPVLTTLTHTLNKEPVPGPLPIAGAGMAFALSRRLRRRIKQAS